METMQDKQKEFNKKELYNLRLIEYIQKQCLLNGVDSQIVDMDFLIDDKLLYEENITIIDEHLNMLFHSLIPKMKSDEAKELLDKQREETKRETDMVNLALIEETKKVTGNQMDLDQHRIISILGDIHSGKTNLAFSFLNNYKGTRKLYTLGYPKEMPNIKNIISFREMSSLKDSIIFVDELHKYISANDRHTCFELVELFSMIAHQNNTIIFTTSASQFITRPLEVFIDTWCLTRIRDIGELKNGSKPKRILRDTKHPLCSSYGLFLENGTYLISNTTQHGIFRFENQNIGKDWK